MKTDKIKFGREKTTIIPMSSFDDTRVLISRKTCSAFHGTRTSFSIPKELGVPVIAPRRLERRESEKNKLTVFRNMCTGDRRPIVDRSPSNRRVDVNEDMSICLRWSPSGRHPQITGTRKFHYPLRVADNNSLPFQSVDKITAEIF